MGIFSHNRLPSGSFALRSFNKDNFADENDENLIRDYGYILQDILVNLQNDIVNKTNSKDEAAKQVGMWCNDQAIFNGKQLNLFNYQRLWTTYGRLGTSQIASAAETLPFDFDLAKQGHESPVVNTQADNVPQAKPSEQAVAPVVPVPEKPQPNLLKSAWNRFSTAAKTAGEKLSYGARWSWKQISGRYVQPPETFLTNDNLSGYEKLKIALEGLREKHPQHKQAITTTLDELKKWQQEANIRFLQNLQRKTVKCLKEVISDGQGGASLKEQLDNLANYDLTKLVTREDCLTLTRQVHQLEHALLAFAAKQDSVVFASARDNTKIKDIEEFKHAATQLGIISRRILDPFYENPKELTAKERGLKNAKAGLTVAGGVMLVVAPVAPVLMLASGVTFAAAAGITGYETFARGQGPSKKGAAEMTARVMIPAVVMGTGPALGAAGMALSQSTATATASQSAAHTTGSALVEVSKTIARHAPEMKTVMGATKALMGASMVRHIAGAGKEPVTENNMRKYAEPEQLSTTTMIDLMASQSTFAEKRKVHSQAKESIKQYRPSVQILSSDGEVKPSYVYLVHDQKQGKVKVVESNYEAIANWKKAQQGTWRWSSRLFSSNEARTIMKLVSEYLEMGKINDREVRIRKLNEIQMAMIKWNTLHGVEGGAFKRNAKGQTYSSHKLADMQALFKIIGLEKKDIESQEAGIYYLVRHTFPRK